MLIIIKLSRLPLLIWSTDILRYIKKIDFYSSTHSFTKRLPEQTLTTGHWRCIHRSNSKLLKPLFRLLYIDYNIIEEV